MQAGPTEPGVVADSMQPLGVAHQNVSGSSRESAEVCAEYGDAAVPELNDSHWIVLVNVVPEVDHVQHSSADDPPDDAPGGHREDGVAVKAISSPPTPGEINGHGDRDECEESVPRKDETRCPDDVRVERYADYRKDVHESSMS